MKKKAIISILIVVVFTFLSGCKYFEPKIINDQNVKQTICNLTWGADSPSDLKVIEWKLNGQHVGGDCTGYIVTYEVKNGERYILASVIKFDDTEKYEVEIVANERYLNALRKYLK